MMMSITTVTRDDESQVPHVKHHQPPIKLIRPSFHSASSLQNGWNLHPHPRLSYGCVSTAQGLDAKILYVDQIATHSRAELWMWLYMRHGCGLMCPHSQPQLSCGIDVVHIHNISLDVVGCTFWTQICGIRSSRTLTAVRIAIPSNPRGKFIST